MSIGFNPGFKPVQAMSPVQQKAQPKFAGNFTVEVTDKNFEEEVLKSDVPVLVDLWAPWCGPCRSIAPALEELAEEYQGKFKIAKVNVDENQGIFASVKQASAKMGAEVRGIPAFLVMNNGKFVMKPFTGARPKHALKELLDAVLKAKDEGKLG